jgi:hypothetical protein
MYTLISMILYSSIISTPVSMTKNQYLPNSGLNRPLDTQLSILMHLCSPQKRIHTLVDEKHPPVWNGSGDGTLNPSGLRLLLRFPHSLAIAKHRNSPNFGRNFRTRIGRKDFQPWLSLHNLPTFSILLLLFLSYNLRCLQFLTSLGVAF